MKKLSRKLFISILTVAFAVIALGTTTFAWFTLSNVASIQPFSAEVSAGEGIEISLDGNSWYSSLTPDIMNDYLFAGYTDGATPKPGVFGTGFRFNNVTTTNGSSFSQLNGDLIAETVDENGQILGLPYLVFTLSFRSPKAMDVYWSEVTMPNSTVADGDLGQSWKADVDFNDGEQTQVLTSDPARTYYASNAARISVIGATKTYVYEKPDSVTATGVVGNTVLGGLTAQDLTAPINANYLFGAIEYFYNKNSVYPNGITSVTVPTTITSLPTLDTVDAELLTLVKVDPVNDIYYTGTITVRIWLEGWDADCYNSILSSKLAVSLKFTGKDVA